MKNATLYLPGFHLATLRRRPRSASQKLADQFAEIRRKSISQLAACFAHFIPGQARQKFKESDLGGSTEYGLDNHRYRSSALSPANTPADPCHSARRDQNQVPSA
jgi:hypothetical protein